MDTLNPARRWLIRDLGRQPFAAVWRAMETFTDTRSEEAGDELWLVEHDPIFTLGQAGKDEHVLLAGDIPVVRTNRGGQVTYHGPGQIVAYPLVDIRRLGLGVREFVERIEQAMINTLAHWQIQAARRVAAPGVYVADAKIGALGLRVRRGCSFHGLALNVDLDLEPFSRINPCGYHGLQVTSVLKSAGSVAFVAVQNVLITELSHQLGLHPESTPHLPALLQTAPLPA